MKNMKVAIPSDGDGGLNGKRSGHFGHCDVFTLIDIHDEKISHVEIVPNSTHIAGGCMVPVNLLACHNVDAIIVSGMGSRPLMGFNQAGIEVYYEGNTLEIKSVLEDFIAGKLDLMTNDRVCGGGNH
jgi:predicted Fe-Mo cluster-binding NifX family protein